MESTYLEGRLLRLQAIPLLGTHHIYRPFEFAIRVIIDDDSVGNKLTLVVKSRLQKAGTKGE